MGDLEAILARLDLLESENWALRDRLSQVDSPADAAPGSVTPVTRREVLRRVGSGAALVGLGTVVASVGIVARPAPVAAADGDIIKVGGTFDGATPTVLTNTTNTRPVLGVQSTSSGTAIVGGSDSGEGVFGSSNSLNGIHGTSNTATGVFGDTISGTGVRAEAHGLGIAISARANDGTALQAASQTGTALTADSDEGPGILASSVADIGVTGISRRQVGVSGASQESTGVSGLAESAAGDGVFGENTGSGGGVGVHGRAHGSPGIGVAGAATTGSALPHITSHTGVLGVASHGRGGVFQGDVAALQLIPSTATSHPATGSRGDLVVDRSGRLWFCKGGSAWKQLA